MSGEDKAGAPGKGRSVWIGLTAILFVAAAAAGWIWLRRPAAPVPLPKAPEVGVVDLHAAMKSHSAYPALLRLRAERSLLASEAASVRKKLLSMKAPEAARKPFADAAEQKTRQQMIRERAALLEKLEEAERAKREELRAAYEAAREEINAAYANEIFNAQLKLDNADLMRLSKETVADLKAHLENLQRDRGQKQFALYTQHEEEIRAYKEALAAEHGMSLAALEAETEGRLMAEEMRRRSEAQARNLDALQKNLLDAAALRMELQQKQSALRGKGREAEAMENAILKELAEKTKKLAEAHHLSVVYAAPVHGGPLPLPGLRDALSPMPAFVVGVSALDLTEELMGEAR